MQITVQEKTLQYLEFSEEMMEYLGIKTGDKFTIEERDGGIVLTPYATIEIDISELDKEILGMIIKDSCEKDISCNEVIAGYIEEFIKQYE